MLTIGQLGQKTAKNLAIFAFMGHNLANNFYLQNITIDLERELLKLSKKPKLFPIKMEGIDRLILSFLSSRSDS
jgi:hypothetical protein